MTWRIVRCTLALVGVTAFFTSKVASQEPKSAPPPQSREADDNESQSDADAQVESFARYAMPSAHHKILDRMVGDWKLKVKYRMSPDTPIVESEGTCRRTWILGKRFVLEEFDGGYLAMPFKGHAIYGYDSFEGKYTSAWLDTMSTAITTYLGECREECRVIAFEGLHGDPFTGSKRRSRGLTRFVNDDKHIVEIYEPDRKGKDFLILEITYTRS
ncbi:MAG: DUF1579 family protein [Planctomycetota bacterium]